MELVIIKGWEMVRGNVKHVTTNFLAKIVKTHVLVNMVFVIMDQMVKDIVLIINNVTVVITVKIAKLNVNVVMDKNAHVVQLLVRFYH